MVAKSGWISAALLPGLGSFGVFAVFVVQKRVTIYVLMYESPRHVTRTKGPSIEHSLRPGI